MSKDSKPHYILVPHELENGQKADLIKKVYKYPSNYIQTIIEKVGVKRKHLSTNGKHYEHKGLSESEALSSVLEYDENRLPFIENDFKYGQVFHEVQGMHHYSLSTTSTTSSSNEQSLKKGKSGYDSRNRRGTLNNDKGIDISSYTMMKTMHSSSMTQGDISKFSESVTNCENCKFLLENRKDLEEVIRKLETLNAILVQDLSFLNQSSNFPLQNYHLKSICFTENEFWQFDDKLQLHQSESTDMKKALDEFSKACLPKCRHKLLKNDSKVRKKLTSPSDHNISPLKNSLFLTSHVHSNFSVGGGSVNPKLDKICDMNNSHTEKYKISMNVDNKKDGFDLYNDSTEDFKQSSYSSQHEFADNLPSHMNIQTVNYSSLKNHNHCSTLPEIPSEKSDDSHTYNQKNVDKYIDLDITKRDSIDSIDSSSVIGETCAINDAINSISSYDSTEINSSKEYFDKYNMSDNLLIYKLEVLNAVANSLKKECILKDNNISNLKRKMANLEISNFERNKTSSVCVSNLTSNNGEFKTTNPECDIYTSPDHFHSKIFDFHSLNSTFIDIFTKFNENLQLENRSIAFIEMFFNDLLQGVNLTRNILSESLENFKSFGFSEHTLQQHIPSASVCSGTDEVEKIEINERNKPENVHIDNHFQILSRESSSHMKCSQTVNSDLVQTQFDNKKLSHFVVKIFGILQLKLEQFSLLEDKLKLMCKNLTILTQSLKERSYAYHVELKLLQENSQEIFNDLNLSLMKDEELKSPTYGKDKKILYDKPEYNSNNSAQTPLDKSSFINIEDYLMHQELDLNYERNIISNVSHHEQNSNSDIKADISTNRNIINCESIPKEKLITEEQQIIDNKSSNSLLYHHDENSQISNLGAKEKGFGGYVKQIKKLKRYSRQNIAYTKQLRRKLKAEAIAKQNYRRFISRLAHKNMKMNEKHRKIYLKINRSYLEAKHIAEQLRNEVLSKELTIDELKRNLEENYHKMNLDNQEKSKRNAEMESELNTANEKILNLVKELNASKIEIKTRDELISKYFEQLSGLERDKHNLLMHIEQVTEEANQNISKISKEISTAEESLKISMDKCSQLENELRDSETARERLIARLKECTEERQERELSLNEKIDAKQKEIFECQAKFNQLNSTLNAVYDKLEAIPFSVENDVVKNNFDNLLKETKRSTTPNPLLLDISERLTMFRQRVQTLHSQIKTRSDQSSQNKIQES